MATYAQACDPENPVMDERSRGMEGSEDDKGVRKELVHLFHQTRKSGISRPCPMPTLE